MLNKKSEQKIKQLVKRRKQMLNKKSEQKIKQLVKKRQQLEREANKITLEIQAIKNKNEKEFKLIKGYKVIIITIYFVIMILMAPIFIIKNAIEDIVCNIVKVIKLTPALMKNVIISKTNKELLRFWDNKNYVLN